MKICPNCHTRFEDSQDYCTKCGTPLVREQSESEQTITGKMVCPECGRYYPKGQKYCTFDGTPLIPGNNKGETGTEKNPFVPILIGVLAGIACTFALLVRLNVIRLPFTQSESTGSAVADNRSEGLQNDKANDSQGEDKGSESVAASTRTESEETEAILTDDTSIHTYSIIAADVSWAEAFQDAISKGGYLARINSEEEFQTIVNLLNNEGETNMHYYLGGQRDSDNIYHWMDTNYQFFSDDLTAKDYWASQHWYTGEPSLVDNGPDTNGQTIDENCVGLMYINGTWYLNDTSDDLVENYPDWLTGKVGYIIEYPS